MSFFASLGLYFVVVLGLVYSVIATKIGQEECLRNDLACVEYDMKRYLN